MTANVVLVHGWDASPTSDWYPWLKTELRRHGLSVQIPTMPHPHAPRIEEWVGHLQRVIHPDADTILVGHSIGCQTILRYLERLPAAIAVKGAVFVAGWFSLQNLESAEDERIAKPWVETPINYKKVKAHTREFVYIYSDNDPYVPASNAQLFASRLGATAVLLKGKGHFTAEEGITRLPQILRHILPATPSHA